jgi:ferric-dicitrate binding protein FerR (iron transport regulator)
LLRGSVVASAPEGQTFQVLADGATIRPVGTRATVGQITRVSANELLLTSNVGAIQVSLDGRDVMTIEAGNSFRMEIQPEAASPGQNGSGGTPASGRNRAIFFWIALASIAAGVGVWRAWISND